jgi:DNA-binding NarL/FixJ family response regulator
MVDQADDPISDQDRALLRAILTGRALRQIAGALGTTDEPVRAELRRLLARLCNRRQPVVAKGGRPAPRA